MADPEGSPEAEDSLREEMAYYRRQLDELAGETVRLDMAISGLRHEIRQKRQGFSLLTELLGAIGTRQELTEIFDVTIGAINATLGMDRAVVLVPVDGGACFRPAQWLGYHDHADADFAELTLALPPELTRESGVLLVNKSTPETPLIQAVRRAFDLPFFACVPAVLDDAPLALLLAGRMLESRPFFPPLDDGDVDTFRAIAGLIVSLIQNRRVAALQEANRQIQEATQRKSRFLASMSHELRTPMNAIVGFTRLVRRQGGDALAERQRANLDKVLHSADHLLSLINDLLDLSKVEAGRMDVAIEAFELAPLIAACCAEASPLVAPGVELTHEVTVDDALASDRRRLQQILVNLIGNALKFTSRGRVAVQADAATLADGSDGVEIRVVDTGTGIPAEALGTIFEEFQQVQGSDPERRGTGLGLPLARAYADLLGGTLEVQSQVGVGSTFTLRLPQAYLAALAEGAAGDAADGAGSGETAGQATPSTPSPAQTEAPATAARGDESPVPGGDAPARAAPAPGRGATCAELAALRDAARQGDIVVVRAHIDALEQRWGAEGTQIIEPLRAAAAQFDVERICELLDAALPPAFAAERERS